MAKQFDLSQLDPTRWLVAFAGFVADWAMSREWLRILLTSLPLMFLMLVVGLVFLGSRLDKHELANRYIALGENEIAEWESDWTSSPPAEQLTPGADTGGGSGATAIDGATVTALADDKATAISSEPGTSAANTEKKQAKTLSRFSEVLFRRVQLLEPNDRSQFIIGVTMAQRGATEQARKMLAKIAPDDRPGYAPAHAWMAASMLAQTISQDNVQVVRHHLTQAAKWQRVPETVLLRGSELLYRLGDYDGCLKMLKQAAELDPTHNLTLAQLAKQFDNKVLESNSIVQATAHFRKQVEQNPHDLKGRMGLIQSLAQDGRLDEGEAVIRAGLQLAPGPELTRGLSEIYRLRYLKSLKQDGDLWSGDLQMLDLALRTDPTNAMVGEEIAKLARLNGKSPGDDLISKLRQFLAEGKATAATHAWIAELYLIRNEFARAIPHLEQVVTRLPTSAQYLNNLAYVIADVAPERLPEALTLVQRAVKLEPRSADYFDTLAKVLAAMDRKVEAIAAIESAIELRPQRADFHQRAIALYQAAGDSTMAEQHGKLIELIAEFEAKSKADKQAADEAATQQAAAERAAADQAAAKTAPAEVTEAAAELAEPKPKPD